jgi:hypothetical protein
VTVFHSTLADFRFPLPPPSPRLLALSTEPGVGERKVEILRRLPENGYVNLPGTLGVYYDLEAPNRTGQEECTNNWTTAASRVSVTCLKLKSQKCELREIAITLSFP